jgi:hypothetical protein
MIKTIVENQIAIMRALLSLTDDAGYQVPLAPAHELTARIAVSETILREIAEVEAR